MRSVRVPVPLRDRLGHEASTSLLDMVDSAGAEWKDDVMMAVGDRFERRLTEAITELRVDVIREIHSGRVEIIKWSFAFWVTQLAAFAGLVVAVLWRTLGH